MKIDLKKLARDVAKVAVPVVVGAVLTHKSVKAAAIEAAKAEVLKRLR